MDLDGTNKEFPDRLQAKRRYRKAWLRFKDSTCNLKSQELAQKMDAYQQEICHGPGQLWKNFTGTLPGYNKFWKKFVENNRVKLDDLKENKK